MCAATNMLFVSRNVWNIAKGAPTWREFSIETLLKIQECYLVLLNRKIQRAVMERLRRMNSQ